MAVVDFALAKKARAAELGITQGEPCKAVAERKKAQEAHKRQHSPRRGDSIDWPELTEKGGAKGRSQKNIAVFLDHIGAELTFNGLACCTVVRRVGRETSLTDEAAKGLWLEADAMGLAGQARCERGQVNDFPEGGPGAVVLWQAQYLRDPTGNRRYWPVTISGRLDPDEMRENIVRDRDQLWAEAAAAESAGESSTLPKHLWQTAAESQRERLLADPWQERLETYLDGREFETTDAIYEALGVMTAQRNTGTAQRIAGILTALGYARGRRRIEGRLTWGYENAAG